MKSGQHYSSSSIPYPKCFSTQFTAIPTARSFQQEQRSKSRELLSRRHCPTRPHETASPRQLFQISPCQPKVRKTCSSAGPIFAFFSTATYSLFVPPRSQTIPPTFKYKCPHSSLWPFWRYKDCNCYKDRRKMTISRHLINHRAWNFPVCGKPCSTQASIQESGL